MLMFGTHFRDFRDAAVFRTFKIKKLQQITMFLWIPKMLVAKQWPNIIIWEVLRKKRSYSGWKESVVYK